MKCINNPALLSGFASVLMYPAMAPRTKRGKKIIAVKQRSVALGFVMNLTSFAFLATLANRVESEIGFANLCILLVFTLALGGCIPQPSAAFKWSF